MPLTHIRYAIRSFRRSPLFAATAILSLSVAIGANTAVFSLIDQLLLRMLPVKDPQELVQLAQRGPFHGSNWGMNAISYPMYRDIRDRNQVFKGVFCRFGNAFSLGSGGRTERVTGELVSGNYFQVLGVTSATGRVIAPDDDTKPGANPVAVISYDYWTSRFNQDPGIAGRTIHVNGQPLTVIGVSQSGFRGVEIGDSPSVFVPISMEKQMFPNMWEDYTLENRRARWVNVFARLKPGVSVAQAKAGVEPLYKQIINMEVREPAFNKTTEYTRKRFLESKLDVFDGATGRSYLRENFTKPLYVLMAITGLVLVIACANVANLLLARATTRQKEIAVRLAMGASRGRIVGQLLTESALLAGVATAAGLALAVVMVQSLLQFVSADSSDLNLHASLDGRVLGFSIAVAFLSTMLFGLIPALKTTRPDVSGTLKSEIAGIAGGVHARFRRGLVIAQVTLSLLLLIGSGLFVRSLANLRTIDTGFNTSHIVSFNIDPPTNGYTAERTATFYRELTDAMKSLPGYQSAGYGVVRVLDGNEWDSTVAVEGYQAKQSEDMNPYFNAVSPGYFATLGVPLLAGRDFDARDAKDSEKVCIVNESFARKYFPNGEAVGRHLGQGGDPGTKLDKRIIGIVRDTKYENMREKTIRQVFIPQTQMPVATGVTVYVRTAAEPSQVFSGVRAAVHGLDANLPVYAMRTLDDQVNRALATERMVATLSSVFGIMATLLAVVGLYGLMAFSVARRAREIAIRMAMGADTRCVLRLVMAEAAILVGGGLLLGLPAYLALSRFVQSQLYGIQPNDAVTVAAASGLLALVALFAGFVPARRAAALDPMEVLRWE